MIKLGLSYSDICIEPGVISEIRHRKDCKVKDDNGFLPLFTAPMDSVIGVKNMDQYKRNGIIPILPRTVPFKEGLDNRIDFARGGFWIAVGLGEFNELLDNYDITGWKILIDIANGHMKELYTTVEKAKKRFNFTVMVGNIANPETIRYAEDAGADYIRCGIGSGRGCITSSNTAIHYPMASLINEAYEIKSRENLKINIVADGGIRGYDDVIKALEIGADYVMIGSVFTKMLESSAPVFTKVGENYILLDNTKGISYQSGKFYWHDREIELYKTFYGMASKSGQIAMGKKDLTTSEGIKITLPVEYTMEAWAENFIDYLRSSMSYLGVKDIKNIQGSGTIVRITEGTRERVNQ